jgi:hypothetical protein
MPPPERTLKGEVRSTRQVIAVPGHAESIVIRGKFPAGTDPYVLCESANTITTYGYDPMNNMPESKITLCQITAA